MNTVTAERGESRRGGRGGEERKGEARGGERERRRRGEGRGGREDVEEKRPVFSNIMFFRERDRDTERERS